MECRTVDSVGAMINAVDRSVFQVLVVELGTIAADPDGLAFAQREPRLHSLPLVAVGEDEGRAKAMGAVRFVPFPLDPERFLAGIREARGGSQDEQPEAIRRTALLSRVGGNLDAAAQLLARFMADYDGYDDRIREAVKDGDKDKVFFLLRNLRSAAGAVGADELYRIMESLQHEAEEGEPFRVENLSEELKRAVNCSSLMHSEFVAHASPNASGTDRKEGVETVAPQALTGDLPILLVVDDSSANRRFVSESLKDEYLVVQAVDGSDALLKARGSPAPALILLDVEMPGIDGYETCRLLKEDPRTRSIPVIFLTSLSKEEYEERGFLLGAVDFIRKPFSIPILKARVRTQLQLLRYQAYLETLVEERTKALRETQKEVIIRLAHAAEYRDNDTGSHIKRIGYFSAILAESLDFPRAEADILFYASSMHDIGKIGIPDNILLKPGKLNDEEWIIMKRHPAIGAGLLEGHPAELLRVAARVARTHHEKWDGTGYPEGLAGESIPIEGRIVAICDVFDALLSVRPYKAAWTFDDALDEINRLSGHHFDPAVVHAFNDAFPELISIRKRFAD